MSDIGQYSASEHLRDGNLIEVRALRPDDEAGMLAALEATGAQSLQRRFFTTKRHFSDKERSFFMNADFKSHVALVAVADAAGKSAIVAGGRYIVFEPGRAEMAFVVIDAWQRRGVGSLLMRHLVKLARGAELRQLTAEVLPDNAPMLSVFRKFGFSPIASGDPGLVHLVLTLG
ncbi:GNAT family N-acetyltransferase [Bradyrhizobium frederickii]|uniref:GNAT family N-acetyltransferase n=1 Tax=Bradyrhizobium frederickii TaxID=2560054 RepID=A0A4Y9P3C1_9BRAD|nr:GNAT family N-acetyltransferase [Bradyrhizobium frederickii]TFV73596.1 GNAT family N-acetyltransferase [Bradyrhizobium frederickii]